MPRAAEQLRMNLEKTLTRIKKRVCPLYGVHASGRPHLVGSAVLLKVSSSFFLVTAAHVLDENRLTSLYTAARNELFELKGPSWRTIEPIGGRRLDRLDIGIVQLTTEQAETMNRFEPLTIDNVDTGVDSATSLYSFVGYPESQNRARPDNKLALTVSAFTVIPAPQDRYRALGFTKTSSLLADFDVTKQIDSKGNLLHGPSPRGISGGGVWKLGTADSITNGISEEKLVALGIEHRRSPGVLIATRVTLVLSALRVCCPQITDVIPAPHGISVSISR